MDLNHHYFHQPSLSENGLLEEAAALQTSLLQQTATVRGFIPEDLDKNKSFFKATIFLHLAQLYQKSKTENESLTHLRLALNICEKNCKANTPETQAWLLLSLDIFQQCKAAEGLKEADLVAINTAIKKYKIILDIQTFENADKHKQSLSSFLTYF